MVNPGQCNISLNVVSLETMIGDNAWTQCLDTKLGHNVSYFVIEMDGSNQSNGGTCCTHYGQMQTSTHKVLPPRFFGIH